MSYIAQQGPELMFRAFLLITSAHSPCPQTSPPQPFQAQMVNEKEIDTLMRNVFTLRSASPTRYCPTHELLEVLIDVCFLNSLLKLLQLFKKIHKKGGFLRSHLKLLLSLFVPISVLPLVSSYFFSRL